MDPFIGTQCMKYSSLSPMIRYGSLSTQPTSLYVDERASNKCNKKECNVVFMTKSLYSDI